MYNMPIDLDHNPLLLEAIDPDVTESQLTGHYPALYRLALAILNDPDEAEDAVQETYIAALSALDRFRGDATLKTWLYAIAVNTCRGLLRKRKSRQAVGHAIQAIHGLLGQAPTPEERALKNEQDSGLWIAVDRLDEKHRLPVLLHYLDNLSAPEIARILGISEGTVHSRLHYARHKLSQELDKISSCQEHAREVL